MKAYFHAPSGVNCKFAPPPQLAETPMLGSRLEIPEDLLAVEVIVEAILFPTKGEGAWAEAIAFFDEALAAGCGIVKPLPATEWQRRFRTWRRAGNCAAAPHHLAPIMAVGRQRVSGRFRRIQRRPAGTAKRGASSDDGGGALAPDRVLEFERFEAAWKAYLLGALDGAIIVSSEVVGELCAASDAVLGTKPRCRLGLGRKVKIGCIVGLHNKIRNACPRPDPYATNLYKHFWSLLAPIEDWYLAQAAGYWTSFEESEFGVRGGNFIVDPGLIDELLEDAGPDWQAAIAAAVTALNTTRMEAFSGCRLRKVA